MTLSRLEPKLVYKHFETICSIPHPSGHEKALGDRIVSIAEAKGFETLRDEAGNIVVKVPATPGLEKAPVVILQGHIDMVGEKNAATNHDFLKDPIRPRVEGDFIKAEGTTLGADNGIGVAAALAITDDDSAVHGPLEILCTVDEEVGLTGAMRLSREMLEGRIMLNLDGEERHAAYIGCAGGGDSVLELKVASKAPPEGAEALHITVTGLKGGHSGCDIHMQKGNALRVLTRCLWEARKDVAMRLVDIRGGNKRNAIPRESEAVVIVPKEEREKFVRALNAEAENIQEELIRVEPDLSITAVDTGPPERVLDDDSCERILNLLQSLPHGVERMSDDIKGLVETSCNLASMVLDKDILKLELSTRSSIANSLRALRDRIAGVGRLAGAKVSENEPYPGWKPDLDSKLANIYKEVYKETVGVEPSLEAIHAGLETGVIGEKFPGMDMISFGPQIEFPHCPDERLHIASVQEFWDVLRALLKRLA
jgi:dipeptidase D